MTQLSPHIPVHRSNVQTWCICVACACLGIAPSLVSADAEASVETHFSGSSQTIMQTSNAVETSATGGGSVEVRIETIENGVRRSSSFRKNLAPGETFRYATSSSSGGSESSVRVNAGGIVLPVVVPNHGFSPHVSPHIPSVAPATTVMNKAMNAATAAVKNARARVHEAQAPAAPRTPAASQPEHVVTAPVEEAVAPSRLLGFLSRVRDSLRRLFSW